jgi:hypothetical protein
MGRGGYRPGAGRKAKASKPASGTGSKQLGFPEFPGPAPATAAPADDILADAAAEGLSPLSEIYKFIETTESKLKKIDIAQLTDETPVTASRFVEVTAADEMQVWPAPGSTDRVSERFFRQ